MIARGTRLENFLTAHWVSVLVALIFVAFVFLSGCASPGPYRTDAPGHPIVEHFDAEGYDVGYVEFDEQGWFWMPDNGKDDIGHREQVLKVQDMIVQAAQYGPSGKAQKGIILVAFVHGWRENADPDTQNNTQQFKAMLAKLAQDERADHPGSARKVVGVYIGWPGLSADTEPFETFSFYSRKNTGDRVGYYGGVTEVLSRLESLNDSINASLPQGGPASFFVVVGHSFGAQVVYDSLMQVVTQRVAERKVTRYLEAPSPEMRAALAPNLKQGRELPPGGNALQPFGDLVVLINPAFEGERYFNLKTFTEEFVYPTEQRPVLAIFCSETDVDTRVFFPIGRYISTFFDRYRDDSLGSLQHETNLHTIPWTGEFVTHRLVTLDEYTASGQTPPAPDAPWNETTRSEPWNSGAAVLYPNPGAAGPWTPFYVVQVDKALIDGHTDIWEKPFMNFLEKFIAHTDKKSAGEASQRVIRVSHTAEVPAAKPGP
jgi:hypothetical protein